MVALRTDSTPPKPSLHVLRPVSFEETQAVYRVDNGKILSLEMKHSHCSKYRSDDKKIAPTAAYSDKNAKSTVRLRSTPAMLRSIYRLEQPEVDENTRNNPIDMDRVVEEKPSNS